MRYGIADSITEDVEDHLTNDEEEHSKGYISEWPAILQGIGNQYDLHGQVNQQAYAIDQV